MAADLRAVALLWELSLTPDADVPPAAPVASTPAVPGSETDPAPGHPADGFEATQELARNDPRHNSAT
jgi:hypothetical protein